MCGHCLCGLSPFYHAVVGCGFVVCWLRMMSLPRVNYVLVVYWWCASGDLVVSWWSVGDVFVQTPRCISLYCAGA